MDEEDFQDLEVAEPTYSQEQLDRFEARAEQFRYARKLMSHLNIKYGYTESDAIDIVSLYNILMDEDKLNELVKKLKMKAFW